MTYFTRSDNPVRLPATVGLLGDVHGNMKFLVAALAWFRKRGVDYVVQVGDFWIYEGHERVKLNRVCYNAGIHLYFIDGNHENFSILPQNTATPWSLGSNVTYLSRGSYGMIGNSTFLAMGGAVTTDQERRTMNEDWWAEENLTDQDVEHGTQGTPVDIMFTHDIPNDCRTEYTHGATFSEIVVAQQSDYATRMNEIYRYNSPNVLVHGHYHKHYTETVDTYSGITTHLIGMGADVSLNGAACIINESGSILDVGIL